MHVPHALMRIARSAAMSVGRKNCWSASAPDVWIDVSRNIKQVNVGVLRLRFGLIDDSPLQPSIAAEPREGGSKTNASCFKVFFDRDQQKNPPKTPHPFTLA
jgi:hypothetical protein